MSILRKLHNFSDPQLDRMIQEIVLKINAISPDAFGAEAEGVAATLDAEHLTDFAHGDIAHSNRAALNLVSGTNTGDDKTAVTGILKGNGSTISVAGSGTDIKTVNGVSLLGSGDIVTSGASVIQTTIDCGATGVWAKDFTIIDGSVTETSKIMAVIAAIATATNDADEIEMSGIMAVAGAPTAGSFPVTLIANDGPISGQFTINYMVG
jgi:hypothetical protein